MQKKDIMNRQKIAAGNWKMNLDFEEGLQLARTISHMDIPNDVNVILGIPYVYLKASLDMLLHVPRIDVAAQNCHQESHGAYTGEVSASMLESISCPYVIIGHSERRMYFGENSKILAQKVNEALKHGLKIIFCCGESLETRKAGEQNNYVTHQLKESLSHLSTEQMASIVIAYEPIWAIGTGETASPEQAQEMHLEIRNHIREIFGDKVADQMAILYGGSVKAANAESIFGQADVDGGLVGGASLDAEQFQTIIKSFS